MTHARHIRPFIDPRRLAPLPRPPKGGGPVSVPEFKALRPGDVVALAALPTEHWRITRPRANGGYDTHFAGTGRPSSGRTSGKLVTPAAWVRIVAGGAP